jgi:hypothetical protein
VPAGGQVVTYALSQRGVLVVSVADEEPPRDERLAGSEFVPAVLTNVDATLLTEEDVRRRTFRAADLVWKHLIHLWSLSRDRAGFRA